MAGLPPDTVHTCTDSSCTMIHCLMELQHLPAIPLAQPASTCTDACSRLLVIPLAQEPDRKVTSPSPLSSGSWSPAGLPALKSWGQASSSAYRSCMSFTDLSLSHSFSHTLSLPPSLSSSCSHRLSPAAFLLFPPLSVCGWRSLLSRYLGCVQESASHSEHGGGRVCVVLVVMVVVGDCKLRLYASTVIFFITEPALTQIMECTGSLSERQQGESGPLPTLGYANPSAAV